MLYLETDAQTSSSHAVAARQARFDGDPHSSASRMMHGSVRLLKVREHAFTAGDVRSHVYMVESGTLCLYKIMPDGRRQVVEFAYPGDFVGLSGGREHLLNAQALEPVRLTCIPVGTLERTMEREPAMASTIFEAMSRDLTAAQDHLLTVGQRSAVERVACFLLSLSRRNRRNGQDSGTVVLPMTRADIADFLGLTIETVSRTLTKLKTSKLIELEQCTVIRLLDSVGLERVAGGEEGV